MKTCFLFLCFIIALDSFGQLTDQEILDRKTGRYPVDSSYVYGLPFKKKFLFIQGANSKMSHQGELSFDFKMKIGSEICAAREGKVVATKQDSDKGGLKQEFMNDGNHIIIEHSDGSTAHYWHLTNNGVLVNEGSFVRQGQVIGYSGNTGYTAFPHLHFQVIDRSGKELLPRFQTQKGIAYLRPGRWYKPAML